ncbi:cytochrome-c peroxidase [Turneriella parva]|nr:cytochrome c peroxidase [Turneriella parva]
MALAFTLSAASCAQEDKDALFSDTEIAIIKTLIYQAPAGEASNAYVNTPAAATLGQQFFWDTQFSGAILIQGNRTTSPINYSAGQERRINCAACHDPNFGWADSATKPNDVSLGANFTSRNAPTVLNASFNSYSLWDGSTDSVWSIARPAIEGNPHNFHRYGVAYIICNANTAPTGNYFTQHNTVFPGAAGATATATVCGSLAAPSSANGYGKTLYEAVGFAANRVHVDRIFANFGKAIGAYEHLLVSKNSAFDQWAEGNENAMTVSQKRGLKIFIGKGNCIRCHSGPNFSDGSFHNLGVPQVGGYSGSNDQGRFTGVTKLLDSADNGAFNTSTAFNDSSTTNRVSGLSAKTSDVGKFKTPTLRSVNKTPPYFHNGTFTSLWDVVNFYNFAGNAGSFPGTKDPILTTRRMTNEEMEDLVNFLKALEGEALSSTLTSNTAPTIASW